MQNKLVIVGGVAGGATAAAKARRLNEHADIILLERGEYISFANCGLPYYIGGDIDDRDELLVTTAEEFSQRYRIDVRLWSEVINIDREKKTITIKNQLTRDTYEEPYDKMILSPGASPIRPPLAGIDNGKVFTLRTLKDADTIKSYIDHKRPASAVVVGGGFIGLEMIENLVKRGVKTTLLEKLGQILPSLDPDMARIVQISLEDKNVELKMGQGLASVHDNHNGLIITTDLGVEIMCDMLILSVGIRPENTLAEQAGLELSRSGHIKVDSTMLTSDPHIYAVGDAVCTQDLILCIPTVTALAGPANKQARIAACNSMGRSSKFRGTLGTSVVRLFNLTVASTGANEKTLLANEIPYLVSFTHSASHASYYPGSEMMEIKLLFAPGDGRILGAQIVGGEGVDKRIDVLATALRGALRVADLEELELAYAPPYSSAKDPVNVAGFVANNILKEDMQILNWREIGSLPEDHVLIDLREDGELEALGPLKGAMHIPLGDLRHRLSELDKKKSYVVYCAIGLRGYIALRILVQNGFKVRNLSGGLKTYVPATRE
ncbi:MAG: FAD-dependent oxidoreductase [Deltaproteobacteria bacterium]|nr:FAD-dependent oxidoreductase [Deltaproteobacteria bacterium]